MTTISANTARITISRRKLVIALLVTSIILPGIPIPGLFTVRIEELMGLVLLPLALPHLRGRWSMIDLAFFGIVLSTLISMIWGTLVMGIKISPRDFMEFVKPVKYWFFFHLAVYPWSKRDITVIISWLLRALTVAGFIGVLQWLNWFGIGDLFVHIFSDTGNEKGRIIGTAANPNDYSLLLFTGFAFVASSWFWFRPRWRIIVATVTYLLLVLLIYSRSGALGMGIVITSVMALYLARVKDVSFRRWIRYIIFIILIIFFVAVAIGPGLINKVKLIQSLSGKELLAYLSASPLNTLLWRLIDSQAGLELRTSIWLPSWQDFLQSPVLGWGPGKSAQTLIVDNQYIFYLRRYGILGLLIYLGLFWSLLRIGWRLVRNFPIHSQELSLGIALVSINLAYLAVNMFINTYYNLQVMSVFWLMCGIIYSTHFYSRLPRMHHSNEQSVVPGRQSLKITDTSTAP